MKAPRVVLTPIFFLSTTAVAFAAEAVPAATPEPTAAAPAAVEPARAPAPTVAAAPTSGAPANTIGDAEVFSDDWWNHARPTLELHGYLRMRGEMFHNFSLGREDAPGSDNALWAQPLDNQYTDLKGNPNGPMLCGNGTSACSTKQQRTANMRFRLNPELHLSDNLRVMSQIDALDNVVMGSTPSSTGLYSLGSATQGPPTAGVNGFRNSVDVKRAWAEYTTPIGQLRFGRMPMHWGLGMIFNAGNGLDQDYQSTYDRVQFTTSLRGTDVYIGGAWDLAATGPTSGSVMDVYGGQPYNTANGTNLTQISLFVAKKTNADAQRLKLAKGEWVWNAGLYNMLQQQELGVSAAGLSSNGTAANDGFERRDSLIMTHDLWAQFLKGKFRFELEGAWTHGYVHNLGTSQWSQNPNDHTGVSTFGLAVEADWRALEDRLRLSFMGGWAQGDPWSSSLKRNCGANSLNCTSNAFAFNPAYNTDLIFHRRLLGRVDGTYYLRPAVDYDFIRKPNGQKFGGGVAIQWVRASEFIQAPGHKRDLGAEVNAQVYYQAKDGSLNDDPTKIGGFYAMLQYGAFFPMGGLGYLPSQTASRTPAPELSFAQTVRMHLGVAF